MSKKYAVFNSGGTLLTTLIEGVHNIPPDALEISDAQHKAVINETDGIWTLQENGSITKEPFAEPSLESKQDSAWIRIKAERDRRKDLGVKASGQWFHSDSSSRIQQLSLVIMGANMPVGINWKTMAGGFVPMTPALASEIFVATAALDQAIFDNAEVHRLAMKALPDPSYYDFFTGWPECYQE